MRTNPLAWSRPARVLPVLLLAFAVAACSKPALPGDLQIADVTTGQRVGPDGAIVEDSRTTSFWTTDTFYASVKTEGSAQNITMKARWSGPDGARAEASKTFSPSGTMVTTFEGPPPQDKGGRWPAGEYKLEIVVNDGVQTTRDLTAR